MNLVFWKIHELLESNGNNVETTTQQGANKAPDCIYNCYRSRIA
jgi:hypothetical protein